jgi:hypothetical protein
LYEHGGHIKSSSLSENGGKPERELYREREVSSLKIDVSSLSTLMCEYRYMFATNSILRSCSFFGYVCRYTPFLFLGSLQYAERAVKLRFLQALLPESHKRFPEFVLSIEHRVRYTKCRPRKMCLSIISRCQMQDTHKHTACPKFTNEYPRTMPTKSKSMIAGRTYWASK